MKIWRPKDPRAVSLIKLTLWAGLVTWMVFTLVMGIAMAKLGAIEIAKLLGSSAYGEVWIWIVPIWVIFTTLMLIWAVASFALKKLRPKKLQEEEE